MLKLLRNSFISGILLLAPLGVTIFVINFLIVRIGGPISQHIFWFVEETTRTNLSLLFDLLATIVVVILVAALGFVSNYFLGKFLFGIFEKIMDRLPFINTIYRTVKQIVDTFSMQKKAVFQEAVLVEFPRAGSYAIGFLTNEAKGEVQQKTDSPVVNVFVPTTPNPTSGFLIMVPAEAAIRLEMSIADAMKMIISGGGVVPPYVPRNPLPPASEQGEIPNAPRPGADPSHA